MTKPILTILFSLLCLTTHGQNPISPDFQKLWDDFQLEKYIEGKSQIEYKGTPYIEVKDNSCTITLSDNREISGLTIRYNAYKDQMEIKNKGHFYVVPKQKEIPFFKLAGRIFMYSIFVEGNSKKTGYLEILINDRYSIFKQHGKLLIEAKQPKPYQDAKPPQFKDEKSTYYFAIDNELPVKINSFKSIAERLPVHSDVISSYVKRNKLKFRRQEDVENLINYLNSL